MQVTSALIVENSKSCRQCLDTMLRQDDISQLPECNNLCIMLIDIDHFKTVKDVYGHEAGDQVLKKNSKAPEQKPKPMTFQAVG